MFVWQYLYICIFLYYVSLNRFYWYMKVLQSSTIFKQRNNHVKCPAIKIFTWNFLQLPLEKYNCNSTHSAIEKLELTFLLILYFHDFNYYNHNTRNDISFSVNKTYFINRMITIDFTNNQNNMHRVIWGHIYILTSLWN